MLSFSSGLFILLALLLTIDAAPKIVPQPVKNHRATPPGSKL